MRDYDIKRGHFKNIEGKLEAIAEEVFGEYEASGEKIETSYGALKKLEFWLEGRTKLWLNTEMDKNVNDTTAMETHRRYNELLFRLTGFNAKERAKRLKDKTKKGKL